MNQQFLKNARWFAALILAVSLGSACQAGTTLKWEEIPAPVQQTILAHGGVAGQPVDQESAGDKVNGMTLFEAAVKDPKGNPVDLNVTADGTLVAIKTDDAADAAAEQAVRNQTKAGPMKFSHSRDITNPYLPLAYLKQDVLDGHEDGKRTHVERTQLPDKRKTFQIGGQSVEALTVEDRAWENGQLAEVATDYFAQDDAGNVYYLGEDVDEYTEGRVTSHEGSWLLGKDTHIPGMLLPAQPKVGDKFKSEDVSPTVSETDVVVAVNETVTVPAGTFKHCVKIAEHAAGEGVEYKYYAPGVGVVREVPATGDEQLVAHTSGSGLLK